jgi:hypothetical protein
MGGIGSLGFFVKRIQGNNLLNNGVFAIGSTTGIGSSTRKYQYCKQRKNNQVFCLQQIVNVSKNNV